MSKIKNILVVAESINVEDSSGSKANVALIQNLKKAGFVLKVYHYTRRHIELKEIECKSIKELKITPLYFLSRLQRHIQNDLKILLNKPLENKFGFSFTFFNDSKSIAREIKKIEGFKPDLVITLSKGASFRPHHALLEVPELHGKWIAYIHDPYPFSYYPDPYRWIEPGNKQKIKFFKELSIKARWVGFPSLLLKDWMINYFPEFEKKSIIIPHQLQENNLVDVELPSFFNKKKFSLLHSGNLMKQRPPFFLIEGYKRFLKKYPQAQKNSQLLLLGNADFHLKRLKKLEKEFPQLYVSNGNINYNVILKLQKEVSVNIILESTAEISPFLPGKFPHCISSNKFILLLAPENSEVKRLMGADYHYHSEADNVNKIAGLIGELYENWKIDPGSLMLNRNDLRHYLSFSHLKRTIENLY